MASPAENAEMEKSGVHFASADEEISPSTSLNTNETLTGPGNQRDDINPQTEEELKQLRTQLQNNIQTSRMQHHAFEPMSLPGSAPASRVGSGSNTPRRSMQASSGSIEASPKASPALSGVHSPPLTPAGTKSREARGSAASGYARPSDIMTPQRSESPQRGTSAAPAPQATGAISSHPKQPPTFSIGPSGDSQPPSKEQSPAGTPGSTAPGTPRPFTPSSDSTSEPSRKRSSLIRKTSSVDSQYRFGNRDPSVGYSTSGTVSTSVPGIPNTLPNAPTLPRSNATGASLQEFGDKRSSIFGGAKKEHVDSASKQDTNDSSHSSKSNLKRFFKFGGDHKHHQRKESTNGKEGGEHNRHHSTTPGVPFADDHGLESKYGKFGKMLGSGAGGSVRLMKRTGDGTVFAVKQFRDRHPYESEKEYNKKVTAEFCIGSTLHHGNIIETIDIVHEKGRWYEVMEYAPYDLFATVMTGKMGREEVACTMLQILSGVLYLHSMGLAHRDLKLDNVVINDQGIMKLIDFGSAVIFRYPFEDDVVLASGIVGSDPYLAPEVYDHPKYDPRPADIWSIAIIFACMTLRRFPWKAPRVSDNSYRLFITPPDPNQDQILENHRRSVASARGSVSQSTPTSRNPSTVDGGDDKHHHHNGDDKSTSEPVTRQPTHTDTNTPPTIKGPVRLLRLLPRETRHIIGRMLDLDPTKRATMEEILDDPWVQNALVCRQEEDGIIYKAPGHTHVLQPSNSGK